MKDGIKFDFKDNILTKGFLRAYFAIFINHDKPFVLF